MKTFSELMHSKKFITSLIGVAAVIISHFFEIPTEQVILLLTPIVSYIIGQGVSDIGKPATQVQVEEERKAA